MHRRRGGVGDGALPSDRPWLKVSEFIQNYWVVS